MDTEFRLDTEKIPMELLFILQLLQLNNDIHELEQDVFIGIDWDLFLEQALHHRLYPLLYQKVKGLDKKYVPSYVIEQLEMYYKRNTFQMLFLSAEMEKVSKLFTEQKINLLFLKGPVLADELYGDVSLRTSSDLDFLIPIDQLPQAEQLLVSLGYEKDDYIETVLNDWQWRHHHVTYYHPTKQVKMEIHWRLNPGPAKEPSFNELWERKQKSELTSFPVYLLGKEDLFLFLVSHGARHGWSRLRWLVDIHQLLKKEIQWHTLIPLLKKYHFCSVAGQALILSTHLLQTPEYMESLPFIRRRRSMKLAQEAIFYLERRVNLHTDPVPEEISRYHKQHLFSLMSWQQKIVFILSFLYPYPEDAQTLPLPKSLHFLYFPLRPFLWVWRKTRRHALS
ncbi:nucleotidyltransferase family protein [Bacillus alkalicellulosilyticus]|uniref:nucleotidyltransferase domain-containing protein n=1 Tax=Alkalihalobacterium alkalicellulosilyticum TaxID=1912214 RepID=UPI00099827F8|nr:nucleotidyltransferase family protein [Bacillus alkalicellulosilyticus]